MKLADVKMTLSTICGGDLEEEFQAYIPALLSQLKQGQKASIAITVDLKRVQDTATMVTASYSITPRFPAVKKASICRVTGENDLKTESRQERPKVLNMFNSEGGNN
jgi:hypothetical protein